MKKYTLENKPSFSYGEVVEVDMGCFGLPPEIMPGIVLGKGMTHIVDQWIVKFDCTFPSYPYKAMLVQHTFIIDKSK